ncbi:MAG: hypothetical protein LBD23_20800 [Oscillospiraceae bacterium]|jgi:hypothetical protein|nr:hypothetical protein [Oscillospiraceae bacterium]
MRNFNDFFTKFNNEGGHSDKRIDDAQERLSKVVKSEHEQLLSETLLTLSSTMAMELLERYHAWLHEGAET